VVKRKREKRKGRKEKGGREQQAWLLKECARSASV